MGGELQELVAAFAQAPEPDPYVDGAPLLEQVSKRIKQRGKKRPVLIITGFTLTEDEKEKLDKVLNVNLARDWGVDVDYCAVGKHQRSMKAMCSAAWPKSLLVSE